METQNETSSAPAEATATVTFASFNLPQYLAKAIAAQKFEIPTPIQAQAIPLALEGKDLIGQAQTGSGKTAAFLIPMITRLLADKTSRGLVLVPTRELANQVEQVFRDLGRSSGLRSVVLIGGASMVPQLKMLRMDPHLIVATPGRLIDHLQRRSVRLGNVKTIVFDEADRMLDMGFMPQIQQILPALPAERQSMLFSATMPPEIKRLAERFLKSPTHISLAPASMAPIEIKQSVRRIAGQDKKMPALLEELATRVGSMIVFTRTKHRADRVARSLEDAGHEAERIHGDRSQAQRERALRTFKEGRIMILVATDIAARGIDVEHVAHVVNFDLPIQPEDYIHRIGRTGRAGRTGEALSFLCPGEDGMWRAIERVMAKRAAENGGEVPAVDGAPAPRAPGYGPRGGGGGRPSGRGGFGGGRPQRGGPAGGQRRFGAEPRSFGGEPRSFSGDRPQRTERRYEGGAPAGGQSFERSERRFGDDRPSFERRDGASERFGGEQSPRDRYRASFGDRPARRDSGAGYRPAGDRPAGARAPFGGGYESRFGGGGGFTGARDADHRQPRFEGGQPARRFRTDRP